MYEYHVTYAGSKKVIKTEEKEAVFDSIRQAFTIDKELEICVQKYDNEWDDFVDTTVEDLPERAKLVVHTVSATTLMPTAASGDSSLSLPLSIEPHEIITLTEGSSQAPRFSLPPSVELVEVVTPLQKASLPSDIQPLATSGITTAVNGGPQPIPLNYSTRVDGIPVQLRRDLKQKITLNSAKRSLLLQAMYDDVTTRYNKL